MFYLYKAFLPTMLGLTAKGEVISCASHCVKRNAGHSKWANIKHTKFLKDSQKAATFTKLGRLMRVAIREGGGADPKHNVQLSHVVEQARRQSMPSTTVNNIIKAAQNSKEACKSAVLEFRGPGGCVIIADILTENFSKTRQTISTILRKNNATYSDGSGQHLFDRKGVIEAVSESESLTSEEAIEHAIEVGAEDVVRDSSMYNNAGKIIFRFFCAVDKIHDVRTKLLELKYKVDLADQEYIPHTLAQLNDSELQAVSQLCDKLQENPDVVRLFDNIA